MTDRTSSASNGHAVLLNFTKAVTRLIAERGFLAPTDPQIAAIPRIVAGRNVLLIAPTGTGKTEAAFLPILDALYRMELRPSGIKLLYITPLRALNRDLLDRLSWWCIKLDLRLAVRHGDTELGERGRQALQPPDVLITTPETLQALLPGWRFRRHLAEIRWVVVDEVHELAEDKRGSQLALALERLRYVTQHDFQVIGLSATVGTPDRVGAFLVGVGRACEVVPVPVARGMQLRVVYPAPTERDTELAAQLYTFPDVAARVRLMRELIEQHQSTLVFSNTRSEAEILASRFRIWDPNFPIAVHHGSLAKPTRVSAERELKEGQLRAVIATSSLELGIDIGPLDLVIQYNSPRQVTRLLQRVGRSGHRVGAVAQGIIITWDPDDTLEAAVIARRALREQPEPVSVPMRPLDALTHQIVGLLLHKPRWHLREVLDLVRHAAPYGELTELELRLVLRYMHERYPRLAWVDPEEGWILRSRATASFYDYYFTTLSMIPEEKQYLIIGPDKVPVGVLDAAFMAEHGVPGTKFVVAGRVWRIEQVDEDRVLVSPDPDPTGAIPSWVGEEIPVPFEVAQEVGALRRRTEEELAAGVPLERIAEGLRDTYPADPGSMVNALRPVAEHRALSLPTPTDHKLTVEGWRDYVIVQACFGHLVNRTLGRLLGHVLAERIGEAIAVQQDPYRVILRSGRITPEEVATVLRDLGHTDVDTLMRQAIIRSGIFKRRFLHVAQKFGAVSKEAELSSTGLTNLIETFRDTAVYEEAVRTALHVDADVPRTRAVLQELADGQRELSVLGVRTEPTPIARFGLAELAWKGDLVPPDRLRRLILEAARGRLLTEARTLVCTACWDYAESVKIVTLVRSLRCPDCGSQKLGMVDEGEERVRQLSTRMRSHPKLVPRRFRRLHQRITATASLIQEHGFPAAIALAGRNLRPSDVADLLRRDAHFSDRLVELIVEAERKALRRRFAA